MNLKWQNRNRNFLLTNEKKTKEAIPQNFCPSFKKDLSYCDFKKYWFILSHNWLKKRANQKGFLVFMRSRFFMKVKVHWWKHLWSENNTRWWKEFQNSSLIALFQIKLTFSSNLTVTKYNINLLMLKMVLEQVYFLGNQLWCRNKMCILIYWLWSINNSEFLIINNDWK